MTFHHCKNLSANGGQNDFVVIQNDEIREITELSITKNQIHITVNHLTESPVTIKLAQADYAEIHIFNEANLPICPFAITIG